MKTDSEIKEYYNELATSYDQDRFDNTYGRFIDRNERMIIEQLLLKEKGSVILDLACGSGRFLNYATIGIDVSEEMIKVSQKKFREKKLYVADGEHLPLEDNSVDVIFSFHLFMHLNDEKIARILTECNRVLKDNGKVIFDIPSKKRRQLLNKKRNGWHGSYSMALKDLKENKEFKITRSFGLLLLPIHRLPPFIRPVFTKVDHWFANSFFKEYSSYLIIEMKKK
ncbi:class I SAM-dependent methyltransferase [Crocinitomicaceae bacterium CZZ-1]|uniref:Class I SAM-dependent methyltransferase n=1 Tax=Taishania pollutisoli TaxID=2766479 RepID=A0A8J6TRW9_9FLAO|nr:class I SAM-dependent methyltransferase [Taishania pollutisoli]MBC9811572.1 class I SAM-dependent methyltransferase [Taishania pollutisoli]